MTNMGYLAAVNSTMSEDFLPVAILGGSRMCVGIRLFSDSKS
jgi:hypothetical protein